MGDAADDMWDSAMRQEHDWMMFMKGIKETCKGDCDIASVPYEDDEEGDWLPLMCITCKERFDWP